MQLVDGFLFETRGENEKSSSRRKRVRERKKGVYTQVQIPFCFSRSLMYIYKKTLLSYDNNNNNYFFSFHILN